MLELGGRRAEDGCEDSFDGVGDDDSSNDEDAIVLDENAGFSER